MINSDNFFSRIFLFCIIFLFTVTFINAASLKDVLKYTLANNVEIKIALSKLNLSKAAQKELNAGFFPNIQISSGFNLNASRKVLGQASNSGSVNIIKRNKSINANLVVQQNIFSGFKTTLLSQAAEENTLALVSSLDSKIQNILLNSIKAYADVWTNRKLLKYRKLNVKSVGAGVRSAEDRLRVGEGTNTDVLEAKSMYQNSLFKLEQAKAQLAKSNADFFKIVGFKPGKIEAPKINQNLIPHSLTKSILQKALKHPSIISTYHILKSREEMLNAQYSNFLPSVDVSAIINRDFDILDGSLSPHRDSLSLKLSVNIPIFNGGSRFAQLHQKQEELTQAKLQNDLVHQQVKYQINTFWSAIKTSQAKMKSAKASVTVAYDALKGTQEAFAVGQRTTLDILNSQRNLTLSQINLAFANREMILAYYNFLSSISSLSLKTLDF